MKFLLLLLGMRLLATYENLYEICMSLFSDERYKLRLENGYKPHQNPVAQDRIRLT